MVNRISESSTVCHFFHHVFFCFYKDLPQIPDRIDAPTGDRNRKVSGQRFRRLRLEGPPGRVSAVGETRRIGWQEWRGVIFHWDPMWAMKQNPGWLGYIVYRRLYYPVFIMIIPGLWWNTISIPVQQPVQWKVGGFFAAHAGEDQISCKSI